MSYRIEGHPIQLVQPDIPSEEARSNRVRSFCAYEGSYDTANVQSKSNSCACSRANCVSNNDSKQLREEISSVMSEESWPANFANDIDMAVKNCGRDTFRPNHKEEGKVVRVRINGVEKPEAEFRSVYE